MKKTLVVAWLTCFVLATNIALAAPGRGGGGARGGPGGPGGPGGGRSGSPMGSGGAAAGSARPGPNTGSPAINSGARPAGNIGGVNAPIGGNRPELGGDRRPEAPSATQRPTSDKLNEFLNARPTATDARATDGAQRTQWQTQHQQWTQNVQGNVKSQLNTAARHAFTPQWYVDHPNAWQATHPRADPFAVATWTKAATWLAIGTAPVAYGYPTGSTIDYEDDSTNTNTPDAQYAVTPDPIEQSQTSAVLAQAGRTNKATSSTQWLSLGVFALVPGQEKSANQLVQLQVSKEGLINGTYLDLLSDTTQSVQGAVDKDSQRVGWSIADNRNVAFDTALANLTQDSAPLIVRFGDKSQQNWTLVRMPENTQQ